nr:uncharacterized protein LOC114924762 [Arachis hypogaea]
MKETEAKAYIYLKSRLRQRQRLYDFALTDYVYSSLVVSPLSVLKHENEALSNAEKRASDEVHSLSERVQRLQASLGTIQSAKEVREIMGRILGTSTEEQWLGVTLLRDWHTYPKWEPQNLARTVPTLGPDGVDLLTMLYVNDSDIWK